MKTNCPCGGLLNPGVADQLLAWQLHFRLFVLVLKERLVLSTVSFLVDFFFFFWGSFGGVSVFLLSLGWLSHLAVWVIIWSMSWSACPVSVTRCVPRRNFPVPSHPVLSPLWCNQLQLASRGLCCDSTLLGYYFIGVPLDFLPPESLKATSFVEGSQQGSDTPPPPPEPLSAS